MKTWPELPPFQTAFHPWLRTREQVGVTATFWVDATATILPFILLCEEESRFQPIRGSVFCHAQSVVNRWALAYGSADEAAGDEKNYGSLRDRLLEMSDRDFVIDKVVVQQIWAISERPAVKELPAPKPSLGDTLVLQYLQAKQAANQLLECERHTSDNHHMVTHHPDGRVSVSDSNSTASMYVRVPQQESVEDLERKLLGQLVKDAFEYKGRR